MSLLSAIKPIINSKTAKVQLEISGTTDGRMSVVTKPIVGPVAQTAPQELHALMAALATPIKVVGEPDEVEVALANAINEQTAHRDSWAARASELEASIQAAAQKDAKAKSTPKASPTAKKKSDTAETAKPEVAAESETELDEKDLGLAL